MGKKIGASKFDFLEDWILFIVQDTNYVHETLQADKKHEQVYCKKRTELFEFLTILLFIWECMLVGGKTPPLKVEPKFTP